jgi:two-component system copper resistance phosphate regulon response regulator CusR
MKILAVENDPRFAKLLRQGLEPHGHRLEVAKSAGDGWTMASDSHFDVMILDVKLPERAGISLCKQFRDTGIKTPILMLTARDSVDDKVAGLAAGADDYLIKPFSFKELLARVNALVRRPADLINTDVLRIRNVELNPMTATVTRAGSTLGLTHKEFAILELLMRNANHAMTREFILDHVWGADSDPVANVVDAVIARLRLKLDPTRARRSLNTPSGITHFISSLLRRVLAGLYHSGSRPVLL